MNLKSKKIQKNCKGKLLTQQTQRQNEKGNQRNETQQFKLMKEEDQKYQTRNASLQEKNKNAFSLDNNGNPKHQLSTSLKRNKSGSKSMEVLRLPPPSFDQLLERIYFKNAKYESIKLHLDDALEEINSVKLLFETIFVKIKTYAEKTKNAMLNIIKPYIIKELFNGIRKFNIQFKKFSQNYRVYESIIDQIYQLFMMNEKISEEVDFVICHFISQLENDNILYDSLDLHRKIFISCACNDQIIQEFIQKSRNYFKSKVSQQNNLQNVLTQLNYIYDQLKSKQGLDNDPDKIILYEENLYTYNLDYPQDDFTATLDEDPKEQKQQRKKKKNKAKKEKNKGQLNDNNSKDDEILQFQLKLEENNKENQNKEKIKPNYSQEFKEKLKLQLKKFQNK